jgi:hypothetical protein
MARLLARPDVNKKSCDPFVVPEPFLLTSEVIIMRKSFRSRPQLEILEDRLPPGDLRGGLSVIGAIGADAWAGSMAPGQLGQDLNLQVFGDMISGRPDAWAAQNGGGGNVLPAQANFHGFSLTDMAAATALFNTSNNNLSQYPQTPFQILFVDPTTERFTFANGGLAVTGTNQFTVEPGTPFYVPVAFIDDSPPVFGTFPTDPSTVANYIFAHDQVGMKNLQIIVDGRVTPIGSAYAAGPVQTPPLLDGGGSHIITVGAFLTPLRPGTHTVAIAGEFSGVLFQQATGLTFEQFNLTYAVTVTRH